MSVNGRLTAAELTSIGNGMSLSNATARALFRMSAAVKVATGSSIRVTPPDGGYRDLAAQQNLIDHPEGPVPIAPLGHSTHGDGCAVDISNWASLYVWLERHAREFEFVQQFRSEPWHWKYVGSETAGGDVTPITEEQDEETMKIYMRPTSNSSPAAGGLSRVWAGDNRLYDGINYSGVWELTEPGARRLSMAEFAVVEGAYAVAGRKVPVAEVSGNDAEIVIYAPVIK